MFDAQAGRAWPSPGASPVPSPCAFSRDKSNGLFSTHLGRWVTLGKKAGPGGHEFSLSLPPWLPARSELGDSPAAAGAPSSPRASRGPETCPVLHLAPPVFGPWALVLGERLWHSSPSLSARVVCGLVPVGAGPVVHGLPLEARAHLQVHGCSRGRAGRLSGQCQRCPRWLCPRCPGWARQPREQLCTCHAHSLLVSDLLWWA